MWKMTTPEGNCIQHYFERQAAKTPNNIAVSDRERAITYAELDVRSTRLASFLLRKGAGPEIPIGVHIKRSINGVIAIMAILKSGSAYVYLDPGYPLRRRLDLAEDCRPLLTLVEEDIDNQLAGSSECVNLTSVDYEPGDECSVCPTLSLDNAAYFLSTSGSTGRPKTAVEVHRCLTARLGHGDLPDVRQGDRCALLSSFAFGMTATRLFLPLALGATVVIFSDDEVKDLRRFVSLLESTEITSLSISPPLLRATLDFCGNIGHPLNRIRAVTVGGSALTSSLLKRVFVALPAVHVINLYGSTETGTAATINVLDENDADSPISIGLPIPKTRVYLLDEQMREVETGISGEIYVGSPHLAREYVNQRELTSLAFFPNPFVPDERLYRTGDVGRRLPNGGIELLGRRDHQVKIRGFRVEPGEIEAALEENESILESAVTAQDFGDDKRLIAWIVSREGQPVVIDELRNFLGARLPQHMIPAAFVRTARLPRTSSGKIDRLALPQYDASRPDMDSAWEPPRNEIESAIAAIWSDVLRIKVVGVHDNFIALGGDSLTVIRASARIQRALGIEVLPPMLFEQTIAEIAGSVPSEGCPVDSSWRALPVNRQLIGGQAS
jgi:amino acid adenylation domain-containing protein